MKKGMQEMHSKKTQNKNYWIFFGIFILSGILMYAAMFSDVVNVGDIYFSFTMLYMILLMACPMAVIMLLFMGQMYDNKKLNVVIIITLVVVSILAFIFLRNQTFVDDRDYLRHMIPHHSIALLTSMHASLQDNETRNLAENIASTQQEQIDQMKNILNRLG